MMSNVVADKRPSYTFTRVVILIIMKMELIHASKLACDRNALDPKITQEQDFVITVSLSNSWRK